MDLDAPTVPPPGAAPAPIEGGFPLSEKIFLALAGLFLASMVCMNVLGVTRFIEIPRGGWTLPFEIFGQELTVFQLAIGVLPYPVTFLCTDLVSELWGKKRASYLVWTGFGLNVFLIAVCSLGYYFHAPFDATEIGVFYEQSWTYMGGVGKPAQLPPPGFYYGGGVYSLMVGATMASMVAYLAAQLCDVHLFHFWKRATRGKHLWLRNNGSTVVSQLLDSVCVITITFWGSPAGFIIGIIIGSYAFKLLAAFLDTPLIYLAVYYLRPLIPPDGDEFGALASA